MLIGFAPLPDVRDRAMIDGAQAKLRALTPSQLQFAEHMLRSWRIFGREINTAIGMIHRAARKAVQNNP